MNTESNRSMTCDSWNLRRADDDHDQRTLERHERIEKQWLKNKEKSEKQRTEKKN